MSDEVVRLNRAQTAIGLEKHRDLILGHIFTEQAVAMCRPYLWLSPVAPLRVSAVMPQRRRAALEILVTIKADMVDGRFAGLDTIHYLLKAFVFDLQSIADQ